DLFFDHGLGRQARGSDRSGASSGKGRADHASACSIAASMVPRTMPLRMAVIGHVEWIEFAVVDHVPVPGEIVHAAHTFEEAAGGGAVAAVQLARLAGAATLSTAAGDHG